MIELKPVLDEKPVSSDPTYSIENEIELFRKDFQVLSHDVKAALQQRKVKLKWKLKI